MIWPLSTHLSCICCFVYGSSKEDSNMAQRGPIGCDCVVGVPLSPFELLHGASQIRWRPAAPLSHCLYIEAASTNLLRNNKFRPKNSNFLILGDSIGLPHAHGVIKSQILWIFKSLLTQIQTQKSNFFNTGRPYRVAARPSYHMSQVPWFLMCFAAMGNQTTTSSVMRISPSHSIY
jgi:hypothetical protein